MSGNLADNAGSDQADNGSISDGNKRKHLVLTCDFYDGKAVPIFKIPQVFFVWNNRTDMEAAACRYTINKEGFHFQGIAKHFGTTYGRGKKFVTLVKAMPDDYNKSTFDPKNLAAADGTYHSLYVGGFLGEFSDATEADLQMVKKEETNQLLGLQLAYNGASVFVNGLMCLTATLVRQGNVKMPVAVSPNEIFEVISTHKSFQILTYLVSPFVEDENLIRIVVIPYNQGGTYLNTGETLGNVNLVKSSDFIRPSLRINFSSMAQVLSLLWKDKEPKFVSKEEFDKLLKAERLKKLQKNNEVKQKDEARIQRSQLIQKQTEEKRKLKEEKLMHDPYACSTPEVRQALAKAKKEEKTQASGVYRMKVDENLHKQREEYKEAKRKEQQEFEKMQQQEKARKLAGKNYVFQEGVVDSLQEEIRKQKEEKAKQLQKEANKKKDAENKALCAWRKANGITKQSVQRQKRMERKKAEEQNGQSANVTPSYSMQQNDPRNLNNKRPMNQSFITGSNLTPVPEKKFAGIGSSTAMLALNPSPRLGLGQWGNNGGMGNQNGGMNNHMEIQNSRGYTNLKSGVQDYSVPNNYQNNLNNAFNNRNPENIKSQNPADRYREEIMYERRPTTSQLPNQSDKPQIPKPFTSEKDVLEEDIIRNANGDIDIDKTLEKRRIARDLEIKMMEVVLRKKKLLEELKAIENAEAELNRTKNEGFY